MENLLLILACSRAKNPDNVKQLSFDPNEEDIAISSLSEETRESILTGRSALKDALCADSRTPIPALDRYDGGMYRIDRFRGVISQLVREKRIRILILSGYYGVVTPSERILKYGKELDVNHWTRYKLPEAMTELAESFHAARAVAFLNKSGPYRRILERAVFVNARLCSIRETADPREAYPALGHAIVHFIQSGFSEDSLNDLRVQTPNAKTLTIQVEDL